MSMIDDNAQLLLSDEAVDQASKDIFALYKKLAYIKNQYESMIVG